MFVIEIVIGKTEPVSRIHWIISYRVYRLLYIYDNYMPVYSYCHPFAIVISICSCFRGLVALLLFGLKLERSVYAV
jgi:hypothetical protein